MMPKMADIKNYRKTENLGGKSNQTQTTRQGKINSYTNTSLSCISHPYARRFHSEDTVEGGEAAMDRLRLVEEAGAAQDVAERNMTAEWVALTTGSAIRKTIQPVFPPWRPKCHTTVVTPTTMECSTMIIIDKGPNKG